MKNIYSHLYVIIKFITLIFRKNELVSNDEDTDDSLEYVWADVEDLSLK